MLINAIALLAMVASVLGAPAPDFGNSVAALLTKPANSSAAAARSKRNVIHDSDNVFHIDFSDSNAIDYSIAIDAESFCQSYVLHGISSSTGLVRDITAVDRTDELSAMSDASRKASVLAELNAFKSHVDQVGGLHRIVATPAGLTGASRGLLAIAEANRGRLSATLFKAAKTGVIAVAFVASGATAGGLSNLVVGGVVTVMLYILTDGLVDWAQAQGTFDAPDALIIDFFVNAATTMWDAALDYMGPSCPALYQINEIMGRVPQLSEELINLASQTQLNEVLDQMERGCLP
ncbi:MAG: putative lipase atg15 [Chaenotheca gracillima]|nr:MAG: putative lipase atg15 [Chaenotheca gracillima]